MMTQLFDAELSFVMTEEYKGMNLQQKCHSDVKNH